MTRNIEYEPTPDGGLIETEESFDRRMAEKYAFNPDKPWRVTWGFGCFSDHTTEAAARRALKRIPRHLSPQEPFDTRLEED